MEARSVPAERPWKDRLIFERPVSASAIRAGSACGRYPLEQMPGAVAFGLQIGGVVAVGGKGVADPVDGTGADAGGVSAGGLAGTSFASSRGRASPMSFLKASSMARLVILALVRCIALVSRVALSPFRVTNRVC